jgi:hypothetical protein
VQFWSAVLTAIPALIAVALWRELAHPGVAIVVLAPNRAPVGWVIATLAGQPKGPPASNPLRTPSAGGWCTT